MDTEEIDTKKDISNRLKLSNRKLWDALSESERDIIVDKYYHANDIETIGLPHVLQGNKEVRINSYMLFLGTLLGIFGSIFASIILKYLPSNSIFDIIVIFGFLIFLWILIRSIDTMSAEGLASNKVLEYLSESIKIGKTVM